jgi:hypothetical protein
MNKPKTPTIVTSAILTLITIFFWVGFEVYRSLTIKPAPSVPEKILAPLDPSLDTNSLNAIKDRAFLTDDQIGNIQASVIPSATTSPTSTPLASASAIPTSSPSATPKP